MPTTLAMFMNTAIDQQIDRFRADDHRELTDDKAAKIKAWVLQNVRDTVQDDFLKEDHGQTISIQEELMYYEQFKHYKRLADFHQGHSREASEMLHRLQKTVIDDETVFAVLMDALRVYSLGRISDALFQVGGQCRRSM